MKSSETKRSRWIVAAVIIAVVFGMLTIISGGSVLFNSQVAGFRLIAPLGRGARSEVFSCSWPVQRRQVRPRIGGSYCLAFG